MDIIKVVGIQIINILLILLQAYSYVILARIILSWFTQPNNSIVQFLHFLTEPLLAPIRKLLEPLTRKSSIQIDLSPLIAWFSISIVSQIIRQIIL